MTFNEIMKQALAETIDERLEQMLEVTPKPKFSFSYKLWERRALHSMQRGTVNKKWTLRKARYVVIAMIVVLSLLLCGAAYAAVTIIGRYSFDDKRDYSKMLIENHPSDKTAFEEYYGLPEEDGWKLTECDKVTSWSTLIYQRGETKVSFDQRLIHNGTMGNISTDRAKVEPLSLYEENDGFLLDFGKDGTLICWIYDGYLLEITGNINKTEAINLAHSTKIIDL